MSCPSDNRVDRAARYDFIIDLVQRFKLGDCHPPTILGIDPAYRHPYDNYVYRLKFYHKTETIRVLGHNPDTYPIPVGTGFIIIRLNNMDPRIRLNNTNRIEHEVVAMETARTLLRDGNMSGLVPDEYAWGRPVEATLERKEEPGWIIMQDMPGIPLIYYFNSMKENQQRQVLEEIASIVQAFQSGNLSEYSRFGGFTYAPSGQRTGGELTTSRTASSSTLRQFIARQFVVKLDVANRTQIINYWSGDPSGFRYLRPVIKDFIYEEVPKILRRLGKSSRCFVHDDLTMENLLWSEEEQRIIALFDFEYAHISHPVAELKLSFEPRFSRLPNPYTNQCN